MPRYSVKRTLKIDRTEYECALCSKKFIGSRGLKSHITQMHSGEKSTSHRGRPSGGTAWNSGLTVKDNRVFAGAQTYSKRVQEGILIPGFKNHRHSESTKQKISAALSGNNHGGRCRWFVVAGQKVQGTWERDFALKLVELGIKWKKVKKFTEEYVDDSGKVRRYTPDFYLEDYDVFIEIKGYWWGNDRRKMEIIQSSSKSKIVIVEKEQFEKFMQGELVW